MLPHCRACARYVFPPRPICPTCCEATLVWTEVSGKGVVHSFTVMRDTYMDGFQPPYVVAQVELAEQKGLLLTANLLGCDPDAVRIGQRVGVVFEKRSEELTVPQFEISGSDN